MAALFAAGVVTGTILSFEMGLLWPAFTGTFGACSGSASRSRGSRSSWRRSSSASTSTAGTASRRARISRAVSRSSSPGFAGSLMVIAVNGWMNHPTGFRLRHGKVVDVHPLHALFVNSYFWHELVHMYLAGYMVTGFLVAGVYAAAGCVDAGDATSGPRSRSRSRSRCSRRPSQISSATGPAATWPRTSRRSSPPSRGSRRRRRARRCTSSAGTRTASVEYGIQIPRLLSLLAFHDPNATVQGLDAVPPADRPPVNVVRIAFQTMVGIGSLLALLARRLRSPCACAGKRLPESRLVLPCARRRRAAVRRRADLPAGSSTEVGRQPWVVYHVMRTSQAVTRRRRIPVGYATLAVVYLGLAVGGRLDPAPARARAARRGSRT